MSAPDTNLKKQEKRHSGPLIGMGIAVAIVVVVFFAWMGGVFSGGMPADTVAPGTDTEATTVDPVTNGG
ncbi:hypothetical protein HCZ30_08590 [Marivivens donghaensis]|uniref:Uncharacterized protein n=1 Tax=Marivivens donghaensis TaxID=1699413 RepID=A0ABX0W0R2_9RHOB|nr:MULTISPECIES: hypothetical protein [Marivivens]NIY72492.1 hypothetical protein [Marivivens donghaensis]